MKKIFSIGPFLSVVFFAFVANATDNFEYIPYIGIDYGYVDAKTSYAKPSYNLLNLNVGTKYNQNFGTEAFFAQSSSDATVINSDNKIKTSYRAYGIDVFAYLPLGCYKTFELFGTMGAGEYVFESKLNKDKHNTESAFGYRFGGGFIYNIDENISIKAVMRYVDLNDISKVNHLYEYSLGLRYYFY